MVLFSYLPTYLLTYGPIFLPTYLPTYLGSYVIQDKLPKVKPDVNSIWVHPQVSLYGASHDGVLVAVGSLWLEIKRVPTSQTICLESWCLP